MFRHTVVRSAVILTAANIITRLMGFFYRIIMSDLLGAEGMGLYQLISPVYMLVWAITSAGLCTAVSKLTAEQTGTGNYANMRRIVVLACAASVTLALCASAAVYFGAPFICTYLLKDDRVLLSMRILALCFPFMAAGSCIRGWFYGMQRAGVPALCQIAEQCTRMAVVYVLSFSMCGRGLEYACAMAVCGMAAGEIISFLLVLVRSLGISGGKGYPTISYGRAGIMLFALALPLTLNRVSGSLLSAAENILIPTRLELYGLARSEAVALYGRFFGMAMPLVMFPSSLLTALSTALMPAVSKANSAGSTRTLSSAVEKSLVFTSAAGIGTAALFILLPEQIGRVIYGSGGKGLGEILRMLGMICPFIYMQVTLSGILNGLGKQLFIFAAGLSTSAFNIAVIWFLVPVYGINAFTAGWFAGTAIAAAVSLAIVSRSAGVRLYFNNMLLKPLCAAALSALSLKMLVRVCGISLFSLLPLAAAVLFFGGMYIILVVLMGVFDR